MTKNVEYPRQIEPAPQDRFFEVNFKQPNFHGKNMSIGEYEICTRWLKPEPYTNAQTGMVVMEIRIPTGYVITNDILRLYTQSGVVPNLGRAESYGNKVNFYFDYVSRWQFLWKRTLHHAVPVLHN